MTARDQALMVVVGLVWSGAFVAGKLGVGEIPPFTLVTVRFVIGGCLLLIISSLLRDAVEWRRWRMLALLALAGVPGAQGFLYAGLTFAPASDAGIIQPILSPAL